jgi:hypothetical protein
MTRPVLTPVGGLEVEIDDDVVPVIGRLRDALADDAGGGATLGEAVERGLPGGEVGDGVFDVQGRHGSSWSAGSRDGRDVGRRAVSQVVGVLRTLRRWGGPRTGRCWTGPEASRRAIAVTIEPASPEGAAGAVLPVLRADPAGDQGRRSPRHRRRHSRRGPPHGPVGAHGAGPPQVRVHQDRDPIPPRPPRPDHRLLTDIRPRHWSGRFAIFPPPHAESPAVWGAARVRPPQPVSSGRSCCSAARWGAHSRWFAPAKRR